MGQCIATTKEGKSCEIPTTKNKRYCHIHSRQRLLRRISLSVTGLFVLSVLSIVADITGILGFSGVSLSSVKNIFLTPLISPPTPIPSNFEIFNINTTNTGLQGDLCGYGKRHSVARGTNGVLLILYRPFDDPISLGEGISRDTGNSWHESYLFQIDALTGIGGTSCSVVLDSNSKLHAVFGLSASDAFYMYSLGEFGKWSEPIVRGQGDPDVGVYAPDIATSMDGSVHLIWSSKRLWYSNFDGKTWLHETIVSPAGWHPDIDVDSNGFRHVVFNDAGFLPTPTTSDYSSSTVDVRYTFSQDGKIWSDPTVVNTSDNIWTGNSTINVDFRGRRHVTFIRDAKLEGDLYYTYSDDGEAWTRPIKINPYPGVPTGITGQESAATSIDSIGNFFVTWQGIGPDGNMYIYFKWLNAFNNTWSEIIEITKIRGNLGLGSTPSVSQRIQKMTGLQFIDIVWAETDGIHLTTITLKEK